MRPSIPAGSNRASQHTSAPARRSVHSRDRSFATLPVQSIAASHAEVVRASLPGTRDGRAERPGARHDEYLSPPSDRGPTGQPGPQTPDDVQRSRTAAIEGWPRIPLPEPRLLKRTVCRDGKRCLTGHRFPKDSRGCRVGFRRRFPRQPAVRRGGHRRRPATTEGALSRA
jgi:hypothetical protein